MSLHIESAANSPVVKPFAKRLITHAFHDIDGTHSLIREWVPIMSVVLHNVIETGLPDDFDSDENAERLTKMANGFHNDETDRFCIESAGLSALTQMEWSIRRAVEEGTLKVDCDSEINSKIIRLIWQGQEVFDNFSEPPEFTAFLEQYTPRLFKLYERVLNGACRDVNLEDAKTNPEKWKVDGSMAFLEFLKRNGVKNYFVTGAVVEVGMGMHEEVETLGYNIGDGEIIEELLGSTWTEKVPKNVAMQQLIDKLGLTGENILVIGDGRAEISAGVEMNAVTISRLPNDATRQRELHTELGTNIIISDYTDERFFELFKEEQS